MMNWAGASIGRLDTSGLIAENRDYYNLAGCSRRSASCRRPRRSLRKGHLPE